MTTDWQPIETAPTDGTKVLIYAQDPCPPLQPGDPWKLLPPFMAVVAYHPDGGWTVCELRIATHWMPLPEPPHA